jgi:hypothetical protein
MSDLTKTTASSNTIKPVQIVGHGNYLYGTLDGLDFVSSGIMPDTKKSYTASIKLKFIMKSIFLKDLNGIQIATQRVTSQIVRIPTTDDKLPQLVAKYNELVGKDLFIIYNAKDGDVINIQNENDIIGIK